MASGEVSAESGLRQGDEMIRSGKVAKAFRVYEIGRIESSRV